MTFSLPSPLSLLKLPNVLLTTAKKWTKVKNARAGRAKLLFLPTKYANLLRSRCRRRCLSSLIPPVTQTNLILEFRFLFLFLLFYVISAPAPAEAAGIKLNSCSVELRQLSMSR